MIDDWSLKGKGQVVDLFTMDDNSNEYYELRQIHEELNEVPEAYLVSDIETLRKKLIEDFAIWYYVEIHGNMNFDDMLKQINKRFGVE